MTTQTELGRLTKRQKAVYRVIARHYAEHRYPPSIREIGKVLDISSPNGVVCHVRDLQRKGGVVATANIARSILPSHEALAADSSQKGGAA